jgi:hypothetical protein
LYRFFFSGGGGESSSDALRRRALSLGLRFGISLLHNGNIFKMLFHIK